MWEAFHALMSDRLNRERPPLCVCHIHLKGFGIFPGLSVVHVSLCVCVLWRSIEHICLLKKSSLCFSINFGHLGRWSIKQLIWANWREKKVKIYRKLSLLEIIKSLVHFYDETCILLQFLKVCLFSLLLTFKCCYVI